MQQREKIWAEKCIRYAQEHGNIFPKAQVFTDMGGDIKYIRKKYGRLYSFYDYIDPKHEYRKNGNKGSKNFYANAAVKKPQTYYLVHYQTHEVVDKGYAKDLQEKYHFANRTIDHLTRVYKQDFFFLSEFCYDVGRACNFDKPEYQKLMLFAYGRNQFRGKETRKKMSQQREMVLAGMLQLSDFIDVDRYEELFKKYPPFQKRKIEWIKASELKK